ncbi:MAG: hypothetical protein IJP84_07435 [Lachnospiraceae bacterium]|nr:hypothetical protein [Lachnospiraceae bacterium]
MNVNAVNILGNAGKTGQGAAGVIKFIPSREETNERLMKEAKANGGISKDGDTVNVSAGNSKLSSMYESKPQGNVSFLKDNDTEGKSVAETISEVASEKGISTELYNINLDKAEAKMLSDETGAIKAADADMNKNADLSQYNAYELKEMYQDGDITPAQYRSEMKSREQNKPAANEKENFQIPKEDKTPKFAQVKKDEEKNSSVKSTEDKNKAYQKAEENDPFKKLADQYDPFAKKEDQYDPLEKKIEERDKAITEKEQREIYNVAEKMEKDPYDVAGNMQKDPYDVALEMQGDPYDVANEMEEKTSEVNAAGNDQEYGVPETPEQNTPKAEENENNRETITVNVSAPETPEQQPELENITINVSAGYAAATDNSENIAAARNDSAQAAVDENVMNNRVVVQEA